MNKAFSYLRVSGKGQIDGDGFDRQRESISKYSSRNGIEVVREFRDEGVRGSTDGFDRPAMNEMLAAIRANGVRTILVERADRLARDLMVGELLLVEFRKLGIKVFECEGGQEMTVEDGEPTRVLIRQVLGAVAQFEKTVIVQKLKAARMRKKALTGRCEGGKPYGEQECEKAVVGRILALKQGGMSILKISETLNTEGVKTRVTGAKWHPTTITRILRRAA